MELVMESSETEVMQLFRNLLLNLLNKQLKMQRISNEKISMHLLSVQFQNIICKGLYLESLPSMLV